VKDGDRLQKNEHEHEHENYRRKRIGTHELMKRERKKSRKTGKAGKQDGAR